jgi:LytS/YehU family sensor histidine kinase
MIKVKEASFKVGIAESKLVALRTQLNPHFIFNALNSIDYYMQKHGGDKASLYLTNFSKLMRTILENSEKDWITLDEELKLMSVYIEIEALRLNHKLTYKIKLDQSLDVENILVPSMLLQPFIENSIVHGISKKSADGHILLSINKEKDQLVCVIDDDGAGRKNKNLTNGGSRKPMGMSISKNRIDYLSQITKGKSEISIKDKEQGVIVTLKIPFKEAF